MHKILLKFNEVLLTRPQFIHHHSPFVSLNKQLCDHLGKFLPIDKLGVRQSMSKNFKDQLKQMPILGAAKVYEIVECSGMEKVIQYKNSYIHKNCLIR